MRTYFYVEEARKVTERDRLPQVGGEIGWFVRLRADDPDSTVYTCWVEMTYRCGSDEEDVHKKFFCGWIWGLGKGRIACEGILQNLRRCGEPLEFSRFLYNWVSVKDMDIRRSNEGLPPKLPDVNSRRRAINAAKKALGLNT